jgi:hypothetical protein
MCCVKIKQAGVKQQQNTTSLKRIDKKNPAENPDFFMEIISYQYL